uniref:Uncharacterized protein n=1 Tax=Kalanchoe fedtschenkoi TaxID=63787 RepID=A0A7N0T637_KALFE
MATRSSVARCYNPLKTNIYLKPPQDSERRDSFEIGVFEASSYYASYVSESALDDAKILDCVQEDEKEDHSMRRNSIKNTPVVQCCDEREQTKKISKKHKKQQPSSPSAKLASYLNSLFNQTRLSKLKRKPPLFEDDGRSSSMSVARYADMVETASVHSCPTYSSSFTRPTPTSSHTRLAHVTRLGYKDFRSYSSHSRKQSVMEADGERWPALTWFDQELNTRKRVSSNTVSKESNEVLKEDKDDSAESDSSSDLFELQNDALQRRLGSRSGELPVHGTTNLMKNIKPRHVLNQ